MFFHPLADKQTLPLTRMEEVADYRLVVVPKWLRSKWRMSTSLPLSFPSTAESITGTIKTPGAVGIRSIRRQRKSVYGGANKLGGMACHCLQGTVCKQTVARSGSSASLGNSHVLGYRHFELPCSGPARERVASYYTSNNRFPLRQ